jgi:hypothetical protein
VSTGGQCLYFIKWRLSHTRNQDASARAREAAERGDIGVSRES